MHLVRHLLLTAVRHNFTFSAQHIPGIQNSLADALSRFHWQEFRQLAPEADQTPMRVPTDLLQALTSPLWMHDAGNSYCRA